MIEAVLFDLGNTLMHDLATNTSRMLEAAGRPLHDWLTESGCRPPTYPRYMRRLKFRLLIECLWSRLSGREVRLIRTLERMHRGMGMPVTTQHIQELGRHCFTSLRHFFLPDVEARPLLQNLSSSGLKLGVVSNTMVPGFAMDAHLRDEALLEFLPVRIYSSEVGYRKPHRQIYLRAVEGIAVRPEHTMFVGDSAVNDVQGPAKLGMTTVLLSPHGKVGRGVKPDHVVRRLSEVSALLGRGS